MGQEFRIAFLAFPLVDENGCTGDGVFSLGPMPYAFAGNHYPFIALLAFVQEVEMFGGYPLQ